MLKSLLLCWLVASLGGVSVFLGPHRYALRKGFFYVKLRFWQTASAKTAISHGVVFCLRLLPSQFHMVGSWGLLVAAKIAISYGATIS